MIDEFSLTEGLELETEYNIKTAIDRYHDIPNLLDEAKRADISFGLDFLDDALFGLLPTDFMLIGARSGLGKTQLAIQIGIHNSIRKKRVLFIALEAEESEVEMRLKYQLLANEFFRDTERPRNVSLAYRPWRMGKCDEFLKPYEKVAHEKFVEKCFFMDTLYRKKKFTIQTLKDVLHEHAKEYDLIVIDHLHYFDLQKGRGSNEELADLVQQIRDLNLFHKKPFIVQAHLRKDVNSLTPGLETYHGSSEIGKQATLALMLEKNPELQDYTNGIYSTIFSIPKARTGALGLVGLVDFAGRHNQYLKGYSLGRIVRTGDKETLYKLKVEEYPSWAGAKVREQVAKELNNK